MRPEVFAGAIIGSWTIIERSEDSPVQGRMWLCHCECGAVRIVIQKKLRSGGSKSCGCIRNRATAVRGTTHGKTGTPAHISWEAMIARCTNPKAFGFQHYGGRGIKICEQWRGSNGFASFLSDMGERLPNTSLDRIDSDGDYEPGNCRWTTKKAQSANRRNSCHLTYNGETLPLTDWSRRLNIPRQRLYMRVFSRGWTAAQALGFEPAP